MRRIEILSTANPKDLRIERRSVVGDGSGWRPDPFDLVLSGLGICTANTVMDFATSRGWKLDSVYIELAMLGEAPWHAIGRKIWIKGRVSDRQLDALLRTAEATPVTQCLIGGAMLQTRIIQV
jgi:uncharacterized OsmC-like protein